MVANRYKRKATQLLQQCLVMLAGLVPTLPKGEGCLRGAWAGRMLECLCITDLRIAVEHHCAPSCR